MKAPLVPVTVAFLAGILVGTSAWLPPWCLAVVGVVSAGVALWRWKRAPSGMVALLLLWACLGALRMGVWERHPDMRLKEILSDEPQPVKLHGLVVDDPAELVFEPGDARSTEDVEATVDPDRQVCVLELWHRETPQGWQPLSGRVRTTILSPRALVRYGDEILVEGQWSQVPAPGNPGQYDWQAALARKRIHGLLRVRPFDGVVVLGHGQGSPILAAVFRLRERWARLIQEHFNPKDAGLLLALLLGERAEIDEDLKEAFQATGTIHLLVVSGFNVGLIAGLLELILRLLGMPWRWRLGVCAVALGGYCVLTGMQPPVARATLMAWIVLGGFALDRVISWPNALAAAALLLAWLNPTQVQDPGFQLSFGAVASLLLFTPRWQPWLEARSRWMQPVWLRRYVTLSLSATSAVWVGLAPVLAWYFHLVSPVSMPANLLIAPLVSVLVTLGTAVLLLATVSEAAVRLSGAALTLPLHLTVRAVEWCHGIPGGSWWVGQPAAAWLVGYYGLVIASLTRRRLGMSRSQVLACWLAAGALWAGSAAAIRWIRSQRLEMQVLDVGHGDSIVVRTPSGRTLLVDTGSEEAGRHRVMPYLRYAGVSTLDALALTHSDEDHLGGAAALLEEFRVKRLLTNGVRGDTMSARRVRHAVRSRAVPEVALSSGMVLEEGPGFRIEVLHPPPGLVPGVAPDSNDNSLVLKLVKGSVTILLTADIEEEGLPWLARQGRSLAASVLKVPHHGSRLGEAGDRFFQAVHPAVALLSVGRLHRLPAAETVQALERIGARIYSTRRDGAIRVRTDGVRLHITTFKSQSRSQ